MWKVLRKDYRLYQRLDNCETEEELEVMRQEMADRFGPLPQQVEDLFVTVRCRKLAVDLGFEKMVLKKIRFGVTLSTALIHPILNQALSRRRCNTCRQKPIKQN